MNLECLCCRNTFATQLWLWHFRAVTTLWYSPSFYYYDALIEAFLYAINWSSSTTICFVSSTNEPDPQCYWSTREETWNMCSSPLKASPRKSLPKVGWSFVHAMSLNLKSLWSSLMKSAPCIFIFFTIFFK